MDTAVALVQAYLHVNGYFTVTEYPLVETMRRGQTRSRTDLDIMALRFGPSRHVHRRISGGSAHSVDPMLNAPADGVPDMIIGEVKEGAARFNAALRDEHVLAAALVRFGCCGDETVRETVQTLMATGAASTPVGHRVRLVAFGLSAATDGLLPGQHAVSLGHIAQFLRNHIVEHRSVLRSAGSKDPTMALLLLLDKVGWFE